jgi:CheY-like chemotaxis protein
LPRSGAAKAETSSEPPVTAVSGLSEHILFVENNSLLLHQVVEMVEGLVYRTSAAMDGKAALAILEETDDIDLLFTDVVMPGGINGAHLAKLAVAARPGLKVLFTSGYTEDALIQDGRLSPGVALLSKPYRLEALEQKLRHVIDSTE